MHRSLTDITPDTAACRSAIGILRRSSRSAVLLATMLGAASCGERYPVDSYASKSASVKGIIDLTRVGDTLPIRLGTTDIAMLVARIPKSASNTLVTFTTSAGFFVLTGTREAKVRAELDSTDVAGRLAAKITIRADTSSFAIVSALLSDYRDTVRVIFSK